MPAGVGAVPWFLTTALKTTALPAAGADGDHVTSVTIRSGLLGTLTVKLLSNVLLPSFDSGIRLMSSTNALTVYVPAAAVQAALAFGPPVAVTVADAPGAREEVKLSLQLTDVPLIENSTP